MTRHEWYMHKTIDAIQHLSEYIELIRDDAMESNMSEDETNNLYHWLCVLNSDITRLLMEMHSKCPE